MDKKDEEVENKNEEIDKKDEEIDKKEEEIENKKDEEVYKKEEEVENKNEEEIDKKEEEVENKNEEVENKNEEVDKKEEEVEKKGKEGENKNEEFIKKEEEIENKEEEDENKNEKDLKNDEEDKNKENAENKLEQNVINDEKTNIIKENKEEGDIYNLEQTQKQNKGDITPFYDYQVDYYKGNISNLVNLITDTIPLEEIPDFLKRAFLLNDLIYSDDYYFKGIFPKILISKEADDQTKVKGLCSFYYENNEDLKENLIIRINCIFAIDNYEKQITMMIDFIKKYVKYNRIEVYLLYDKIDEKFFPNKEAKDIFQNKLGFKWLCVVRDEKMKQRYIKLYFDKEMQKEEENALQNEEQNEEQNEDQNEDQKEEQKHTNNSQNNFLMDCLTILTINNENNAYTLKNIIDVKSEKNELNKKSFNKFINPYPIYSLISQNTRLNKQFSDETKDKELNEIKTKLWRIANLENDWNLIEENKKKITNINFDIEQSLFKDIEKFYMTKEIKCLCDLYQSNISINFENNYSILIDDIYYNRISTDKIKILKEKKTNSTFFLIPSNDNTTFFYVSEINKKLRDLLIDNNKNVYEQFLEFQPSTQKELFEFSLSSYRDITYIPQTYKKSSKTIYIPSFSINSHLFSYNFKDVEKYVKMTEIESNSPSYLTSVDEFINVEFKPDNNIENSFTVIPIEGGGNDLIIKDSFIIGIFDNDIINDEKLPLLQFLYITKDHFLTKNNYIPGKENLE